MIRLSLIVAIVLFSVLFYFSYKAPVLVSVPKVEKAIDMGLWSEDNKGNSLAEK
jgi:hypothetical protein